uniref:Interleukin-7 n=1 Tax=Pavo cristatus TaxID=9049 RepID=A0A8C9EXA8_PAVCR
MMPKSGDTQDFECCTWCRPVFPSSPGRKKAEKQSAFFRSIFRVLPLLLVLSPVNSSTCTMGNKTTEIRVKYENILSHDIEELVNMSAEYRDRCCKNKRHEHSKVFFCNDTQVKFNFSEFAL